MKIITCEDLYKSYGKVTALENLNLTLHSNKKYGVIGPNGAGKTTFIKLICGLLKPTKGFISVFSLNPWKERVKVCRRIGVLHEETLPPPTEKVIDFIIYVGKLKGLPLTDVKRESAELLDFFGIYDKRHLKIGNLSAGQKRRLELALTFMGDRELIILDEPTSNIDPSGRREVMSIIEKLSCEKDATFIISTHYLSYLEKICDEIIILDKGRIVAKENVKDLITRYSKSIVKIRSSDNMKLAKALGNLQSAAHIDIRKDSVVVEVKNENFYKDLMKISCKLGLYVYMLEPLHKTLESIYNVVFGKRETNGEESNIHGNS